MLDQREHINYVILEEGLLRLAVHVKLAQLQLYPELLAERAQHRHLMERVGFYGRVDAVTANIEANI